MRFDLFLFVVRHTFYPQAFFFVGTVHSLLSLRGTTGGFLSGGRGRFRTSLAIDLLLRPCPTFETIGQVPLAV